MIKLFFFIFVLSLTGFAVQDSFAQSLPNLVEVISDNEITPFDNTIPFISDAAYVNVNMDALNEPKMLLTIFGQSIEVTNEKTNFKSNDRFVYVGSMKDGYVYIAYLDGMIRMEMSGPDKNYVITTENDLHVIKKVDPTQLSGNWEVSPPKI